MLRILALATIVAGLMSETISIRAWSRPGYYSPGTRTRTTISQGEDAARVALELASGKHLKMLVITDNVWDLLMQQAHLVSANCFFVNTNSAGWSATIPLALALAEYDLVVLNPAKINVNLPTFTTISVNSNWTILLRTT